MQLDRSIVCALQQSVGLTSLVASIVYILQDVLWTVWSAFDGARCAECCGTDTT